ncbi:MAG: FtsX-like permease family protein, partial [Spirochaetales bacterium]|nr:FtsX-like permease family protein [Spirochaetales bacterium]
YRDKTAVSDIETKLSSGYSVISWREFNSSFFGALKTEKTAMLLVIGLIFIVVGVNIKHSLERSVVERREEIGIMISLGAAPGKIKTIFVIEGFLIGLAGSIIGLIFGLFITENINMLFSLFESTVSLFVNILQIIITPFSKEGLSPVSVFSGASFYISEVPVRVVYSELLFIFLFAVLSSTLAAYYASKMVSLYKPSEVLRYE